MPELIKNNSTNSKRIAKNTIYMYIRMLLIMAITLFTSREVLFYLGVEDYGIYCLVQGIIISFTFVSNVLTSASQRFLSISLGRGNIVEFREIFSTCILVFIVLGFILCIIIEPIGLWLISHKLQVPEDRLTVTYYLFHLSVLTLLFSFFRIPYNSAIISYEKMSFFAYLSVLESVLKLLIVYALANSSFDKLLLYGLLLLAITVIVNLAFSFYAHTKLNGCRFTKNVQKEHVVEILSFSFWSMYEAMANIMKTEGTGFILNAFYGVIINASVGIAKQINSAISNFVANFQIAFRPQITKTYASGDDHLDMLIINTSKLSMFVILLIAMPICFNINFVLDIWLADVPKFASVFSICLIISSLMEAIGGPLWMTAHAIGNIGIFQFVTGTIRLLNLPIVYMLIKNGFNPAYVFTVQIGLDIVVLLYRLYYLKRKINFPAIYFFRNVVINGMLFIVIMSIILLFIHQIDLKDSIRLVSSILINGVIGTVIFLHISYDKVTRNKIYSYIKQLIWKTK